MANTDNKNKCNTKNNNQQGLGLASISYADYVILSSTLSYAIAEELNDLDLDMLIVFVGMITSDLALIRTKRGILNNMKSKNPSEEAIVGSEDASEAGESIVTAQPNLNRKVRKKSKRIKKVKKKKRKSKSDVL